MKCFDACYANQGAPLLFDLSSLEYDARKRKKKGGVAVN